MTFSPLAVVPSMTNCNPLGGSAADLWLSEMSDVKEKESPSAKGPVPNSSKKHRFVRLENHACEYQHLSTRATYLWILQSFLR
jgi:hypothetical protein